jgi:hypothetical protein
MNPEVLLIHRPAIDFGAFLGVAQKVLGYSPGRAADSARREVSDAERFLSCLAALRQQQSPAGLSPRLFTHVSFSALVLADDQDMLDILACCSGMPFVVADTLARGVQVAVITGSLAQWRDAVVSGATKDTEASVRVCFNKLQGLFTDEHLNVWTDYRSKQAPDQVTFLLEDKRK